jgi:hypothetical protein
MVCAHCGSPIEPGGVAWLRGSAYCAACIKRARVYQRLFVGCWLVLALFIVGFFLLAVFGGVLSALFG